MRVTALTAEQAGPFIRKRIAQAELRGLMLAREEYGVTLSYDGMIIPDGKCVCAMGAVVLGEHSVKSEKGEALDNALRGLGISADAEMDFVLGFDDGKRSNPWQRLGDDIATEYLGPREWFACPDIDDD